MVVPESVATGKASSFLCHTFRVFASATVLISSVALWPVVGADSTTLNSSKLPMEIVVDAESTSAITAISNAQQILVSRCMTIKGMKFFLSILKSNQVSPYLTIPEPGNAVERSKGGYGYYSVVNSSLARNSSSNEDTYIRGLSKQGQLKYQELLFGRPNDKVLNHLIDGSTVYTGAGGCFGEAYREIFGSISNLVWSVNDLIPAINEISTIVSTQTNYKRALVNYVICMAKSGFSVKSPEEARIYAGNLYTRNTVNIATRAKEVKVAVADYRCGTATRLNESFKLAVGNVWPLTPQRLQTALVKIAEERGHAVAVSKLIVENAAK